jgi:hypothetical protein
VRLKYFILPLVLVGFGCASSTPPPSAPPAQTECAEPGEARIDKPKGEEVATTEETKAENSDQPICKMEQVIGSNMRKRVCRTREQIERDRREAQEMSRRAARAAGGSDQN